MYLQLNLASVFILGLLRRKLKGVFRSNETSPGVKVTETNADMHSKEETIVSQERTEVNEKNTDIYNNEETTVSQVQKENDANTEIIEATTVSEEQPEVTDTNAGTNDDIAVSEEHIDSKKIYTGINEETTVIQEHKHSNEETTVSQKTTETDAGISEETTVSQKRKEVTEKNMDSDEPTDSQAKVTETVTESSKISTHSRILKKVTERHNEFGKKVVYMSDLEDMLTGYEKKQDTNCFNRSEIHHLEHHILARPEKLMEDSETRFPFNYPDLYSEPYPGSPPDQYPLQRPIEDIVQYPEEINNFFTVTTMAPPFENTIHDFETCFNRSEIHHLEHHLLARPETFMQNSETRFPYNYPEQYSVPYPGSRPDQYPLQRPIEDIAQYPEEMNRFFAPTTMAPLFENTIPIFENVDSEILHRLKDLDWMKITIPM